VLPPSSGRNEHPNDGGDTILRNVGSNKSHTVHILEDSIHSHRRENLRAVRVTRELCGIICDRTSVQFMQFYLHMVHLMALSVVESIQS
jgi:hypothetical protein